MDQEDEQLQFNFQDENEDIIEQDQDQGFQQFSPVEYYKKGILLEGLDNMKKLFKYMIKPQNFIQIISCFIITKFLGDLLQRLQRYDEAIIMYDKAIQLNPNNQWYYHDKAQALIRLKRYDEVISMCGKAIELNPSYSSLYQDKGDSFHSLKRYQEAIQMYDIALQLNPYNYDIYVNKGYSLMNLYRYDEADMSFTKHLEMQGFK